MGIDPVQNHGAKNNPPVNAQEIAVGLSKRLAQGYAMKASPPGDDYDDSTMFQKWYPLVMSTLCELEAMAQSKSWIYPLTKCMVDLSSSFCGYVYQAG